MLTEYINAAMARAEYERLEDGTYFGSLPFWQGIWGNAVTLKDCQKELQEVLEDWIIMALQEGTVIPVIDGLDFSQSQVQEVA
jgi:predicted RNase H-like HicB family nuclease